MPGVSSPTAATSAHGQILLGPQTGLRDVFSNQTGIIAAQNKVVKETAANKVGGLTIINGPISTVNGTNNFMGQTAQVSSKARQANSVKPARPGAGQVQQRPGIP